MSNYTESITASEEFHKAAKKALDDRDFARAETLYRAACNLVGTVIDPLHYRYLALLGGLLVCLKGQNKEEEAKAVELLISQVTAPA
jgi:hypothetical protein